MHNRLAKTARTFSFLSVVSLLSACGGGDGRMDLNGKVTFDGKPVVYGLIEFIPDTEKQHNGPAGSAEIIDGSYNTADTNSGIFPGPHKARITVCEERPPKATDDETQTVAAKPPIITGYTIDKDLKEPTNNFEIPQSALGFDYRNPQKGKSPSGPIP